MRMSAASSKTVLIIAGPTAVGKTAVSIEVAKKLGTSIISADSRQCYIETSVGTAKPTADELAQVPHYFINAFPITENITAARYETLALAYLEDIFAHADTAVVCGGTGLYIKALCEGLDEMPPIDTVVVDSINQEYAEKGMTWLQERVAEEDPLFFAGGETQNPARLLRALSFKRSIRESIVTFQSGIKKQRPFRIIKTALDLPRTVLYERIDRRVDAMMEDGLLEEVKTLFPQRHLKNLQTVGYSELFQYLEGQCTLEEAVSKIKQHTRNYAKRQLTWFRKDPEVQWFAADEPHLVEKLTALCP